MRRWLLKKAGYRGSSCVCPHCQQDAKFQRYRAITIMTLMGEAIYERAYYYFKLCHEVFCLTDDEFRIDDKKTPATCEVVTLAGVLHPFDEAATEVLPKMCGISLSASTVKQTTETVGDDIV
ncbi:MAG: UPF0236 family protein [Planctomycetaceae bacterium]